MTEGHDILDPNGVVYNQINRILERRASGEGATESLMGLYGLLGPFAHNDSAYKTACDELWSRVKKGESKEAAFWSWFDEAIGLLARNGLWLKAQVYESAGGQ